MLRAFISLGSNVDREHHFRSAARALRAVFGPLMFSPVYETGAVGFDGDPFFNAVAAFDTAEPAEVIVEALKRIEDEHGRVRGVARFSDRTLDLDLLLLGDQVVEGPGYALPRDEIVHNAFVLGPLADLAPDVIHPQLGITMRSLWEDFDLNGQWLKAIEFCWDEAVA